MKFGIGTLLQVYFWGFGGSISSNFDNFLCHYLALEKYSIHVYYLLLLLFLFLFLNNTIKLMNKTTKEVYFYTYSIVAFLIFFQSIFLIFNQNNYYFEMGVILLFVYATALLILFLIFLTLTTSESFHDKMYINKDFYKLGGVSVLSTVNIIFWAAMLFNLKTVFTDLFNLIEVRSYQNEFIKIIDNKKTDNLHIPNYEYYSNNVNSYLNNSILFIENLENLKSYKRENLSNFKWVNNSINIFYILKFEIIDEYINYILSALLQISCLVIVIILMV